MNLPTNFPRWLLRQAVSPLTFTWRFIREAIGTKLWFAPVSGVIMACLTAVAALLFDEYVMEGSVAERLPFLFLGNGSNAATLLSTIAGAMATLLALVFTTITIVIQLSSGSYSPRALRTLYQDATMHLTITALVSSFTYALVVLYALAPQAEVSPPRLAVSLSFVQGIIALVGFVVYSHHILHAVRVTSVITRIADRTEALIEGLYPHTSRDLPELVSPPGSPHQVLLAPESGVVTSINGARLLKAAQKIAGVLVIKVTVGDYVIQGDPLLEVFAPAPAPESVAGAITLKDERTLEQDIAFGFRLLVDIAERALSPGVNDPTTAVQVIDQLHNLLRQIGARPQPHPGLYDEAGALRVVGQPQSWSDLLSLSCSEIRRFGGSSLQVCRRLRSMLLDLRQRLPEDTHSALETELEYLEKTLSAAFPNLQDRRLASAADPQGLGHTL